MVENNLIFIAPFAVNVEQEENGREEKLMFFDTVAQKRVIYERLNVSSSVHDYLYERAKSMMCHSHTFIHIDDSR